MRVTRELLAALLTTGMCVCVLATCVMCACSEGKKFFMAPSLATKEGSSQAAPAAGTMRGARVRVRGGRRGGGFGGIALMSVEPIPKLQWHFLIVSCKKKWRSEVACTPELL